VKSWFYGISLVLFVAAFLFVRNEEQNKPAPTQVVDQNFERQKQNWEDFLLQLEWLREMAVREPSRPILHYRQEILKLHYLWLEVRDYEFVKYEKEKRAQLDAYVTRLVDNVEKDRRLQEILAGL